MHFDGANYSLQPSLILLVSASCCVGHERIEGWLLVLLLLGFGIRRLESADCTLNQLTIGSEGVDQFLFGSRSRLQQAICFDCCRVCLLALVLHPLSSTLLRQAHLLLKLIILA